MKSPKITKVMDGWVDGWMVGWMDGWMTCDFTSFLTIFQAYQEDVWMIMKGCGQGNSVYD